ncbi:hypothetical protein KNV09_gp064 [Vibrio phage Athena]|uniref:Uncharacterized protein n=7 Tax=Thalassavirus TaxID=2948922 RepID=A0A6M4ET44_9CAUD|nr:hypothetical protein FDJ20_gp065 [Vibrio phage Thalassa]YP_010101839.1 hypothetical protein KNU52_gp060 [Vibrio phage Achelous]YP_010102495.1 hypothetical protein KNU58_gp055 [Vibrio phage Brizo]YP_010105656.1 hypothetical protein KNU87_gp063 [Vibrio phage Bennett]YP_010108107.1 hypothetical protein KNV06_gp062 [Vibrio phage AG74]YP_010108300.1 hypothetical protein KNV07_gp064 [Vibrio phage Cody]YP_010108689.1 hypothetical protein KNV09_gp064 [Vibrio phage Athena]QIG66377.1 hypothetical p
MKLNHILEQADKHGDFYLYYRKHTGKGTTYLVGTTDFDNKYIQAKHASGKAGLTPNVCLSALQGQALMQDNVIVFSWTNDKFRILSAKDVRRMSPLAAELRNGRNR